MFIPLSISWMGHFCKYITYDQVPHMEKLHDYLGQYGKRTPRNIPYLIIKKSLNHAYIGIIQVGKDENG